MPITINKLKTVFILFSLKDKHENNFVFNYLYYLVICEDYN